MKKYLLFFMILMLTNFIVSVSISKTSHKKKVANTPKKTEWCLKFPDKCNEYKINNEWIDKQVRDCVDERGNHNGKAESWEIKKFADDCR